MNKGRADWVPVQVVYIAAQVVYIAEQAAYIAEQVVRTEKLYSPAQMDSSPFLVLF